MTSCTYAGRAPGCSIVVGRIVRRMNKTELLKQLQIDRSDAPHGGRGIAWWAAGVTALLLAVAAAVFAWGQRGTDVRVVRVAVAQSGAQAPASRSVLDATGYVTARRIATVSAQVTGKVETVLIEEGMRVEAGEVLATLDDTEAQAQLALARAQFDAARSRLAEIHAQLAQAKRERDRQEELIGRGLTSQAGVDTARTQVESLQARLESAATDVQVADRSVELAQVRLDNTVIRAPFAGVVTVKAAQPGEMISPISAGGGFTRTGIGTVVDMDSLEIQVDVNESFIQRVHPGQRVEATLNAYPDWRIPAEVIAIVPTADRSRATVRVRIAILASDARIVPDMGVRVAFLSEGEPSAAGDAVRVASAALAEDGGETVVFVLSENRVTRRPVRVGATRGDAVEVIEGLRGGERVVLAPPAGLADGDEVRVERTGR
jgi:RND family efflux transporter MFP subunit